MQERGKQDLSNQLVGTLTRQSTDTYRSCAAMIDRCAAAHAREARGRVATLPIELWQC